MVKLNTADVRRLKAALDALEIYAAPIRHAISSIAKPIPIVTEGAAITLEDRSTANELGAVQAALAILTGRIR